MNEIKGRDTGEWYSPIDYLNFPDAELLLNETSFNYKYLVMLYYSVLMLGCNELGPVSELEMFWSGGMMLIAMLMNIFIFGDLVSILTTLMRKDTDMQEKIDQANEVLNTIDLPPDIQSDIREYFTKV